MRARMSAVPAGSVEVTRSCTPPATSLMAVFAPGTASGQCAILPLAPTLAEGATDALGAGADDATLGAVDVSVADVLLQLSHPATKAKGARESGSKAKRGRKVNRTWPPGDELVREA